MILRYVSQIMQTIFEQSALNMNHNVFKDQISNLVDTLCMHFICCDIAFTKPILESNLNMLIYIF